MDQKLCECGCGTLIPRFSHNKKSERRFAHGHNRPWKGRKLYPHMVEAIKASLSKRVYSLETLEKKRQSMLGKNKGKVPWHKGTKGLIRGLKGDLSPNWNGGAAKCSVCGKVLGHGKYKDYCRLHTPRGKGENHYKWSGDDVGYDGLHDWIRKVGGIPATCEHCGKTGLTGRKIQWANKSGQYKRDRDDWIRLCVSCHAIYDRKNRVNISQIFQKT